MSSVETILIQCQKGDSRAQKALYQMFSTKMFVHAYRYLKNREDAEDVLVQGFLNVFQNLDRFEYKGEKALEGWIRRIVVNEALLFLRKKKKVLFFDSSETEEYESPENELSNLYAEDIYKMITELPHGLRTIFNLYVIEGYPHHEIAQLLEITESTSRSQLMKARRALQNQFTLNRHSHED